MAKIYLIFDWGSTPSVFACGESTSLAEGQSAKRAVMRSTICPAGVIPSEVEESFPQEIFDTQKILRFALLAQNDTIPAGDCIIAAVLLPPAELLRVNRSVFN